jgi:hypothetical protein
MSAAKIAGYFFFKLSAFVVTDDHYFSATDPSEAGYDGLIVSKAPITVQTAEIIYYHVQIISYDGAVLMAGYQDRFPGT